MKIQIGEKNDDGSFKLTGSVSQEEADFISGIGIATLIQAGVISILQQQEEDALEDLEVDGPMQ